MYKSDGTYTSPPDACTRVCVLILIIRPPAKSQFKLTETEVLTLQHEAIPCSPKTFYAREDVKALALRKYEAGAVKLGVEPDPSDPIYGRRFKKVSENVRGRKQNFREMGTDLVLLAQMCGVGRKKAETETAGKEKEEKEEM